MLCNSCRGADNNKLACGGTMVIDMTFVTLTFSHWTRWRVKLQQQGCLRFRTH